MEVEKSLATRRCHRQRTAAIGRHQCLWSRQQTTIINNIFCCCAKLVAATRQHRRRRCPRKNNKQFKTIPLWRPGAAHHTTHCSENARAHAYKLMRALTKRATRNFCAAHTHAHTHTFIATVSDQANSNEFR